MREILFRGKTIHRGAWVTGVPVPVEENTYKTGRIELVASVNHDELDGWIPSYDSEEVDPATVGQFIGLYDAAGKRIFEGDIVRKSDKDGTPYPTSRPSIVKYGEYNCSCCNGVYGWTFEGGTADIRDDRYVVIVGNIYDNPELLEENVRNIFFYGYASEVEEMEDEDD